MTCSFASYFLVSISRFTVGHHRFSFVGVGTSSRENIPTFLWCFVFDGNMFGVVYT